MDYLDEIINIIINLSLTDDQNFAGIRDGISNMQDTS